MSDDSRSTPVTFSREEIAEIRVMLATWDRQRPADSGALSYF